MGEEVDIEVVEWVSWVGAVAPTEAGVGRRAKSALLAVEGRGERPIERTRLRIESERAGGVESGQACRDVGQSHQRARVAARDRPEQIQVDLDVVGEERLRERRVVER